MIEALQILVRWWVVLMLLVAMVGMTWLVVDVLYVCWLTRRRGG